MGSAARATSTSWSPARSAGASASHDTVRLARLAVECGLFPLFEAEHGEVASRPIRRQVPVEEYLEPQKRFAHLFGPDDPHGEAIARLQAMADRNIRRYGLLPEEDR